MAVIAVSIGPPVLAQKPDQHPPELRAGWAGAGRDAGPEITPGFPWAPGILASCRSRAGACECSFASMETILTFGEAAESVLLYYKHAQAADKYPLPMSHMLRECLGQAVAPIVFPFVGMEVYTRLDARGPTSGTGAERGSLSAR